MIDGLGRFAQLAIAVQVKNILSGNLSESGVAIPWDVRGEWSEDAISPFQVVIDALLPTGFRLNLIGDTYGPVDNQPAYAFDTMESRVTIGVRTKLAIERANGFDAIVRGLFLDVNPASGLRYQAELYGICGLQLLGMDGIADDQVQSSRFNQLFERRGTVVIAATVQNALANVPIIGGITVQTVPTLLTLAFPTAPVP